MARQGWDLADFRCGRCGEHITTTTEAEYIDKVSGHRAAHAVLDQMTPEERARLVQALNL
jgi:DNA-directed RNA polymerase subunit N (RpoN/RPB10)